MKLFFQDLFTIQHLVAMNTLAGIAAKASAAYGLLTSASVPILRFGSLEQAICFAWLHSCMVKK